MTKRFNIPAISWRDFLGFNGTIYRLAICATVIALTIFQVIIGYIYISNYSPLIKFEQTCGIKAELLMASDAEMYHYSCKFDNPPQNITPRFYANSLLQCLKYKMIFFECPSQQNHTTQTVRILKDLASAKTLRLFGDNNISRMLLSILTTSQLIFTIWSFIIFEKTFYGVVIPAMISAILIYKRRRKVRHDLLKMYIFFAIMSFSILFTTTIDNKTFGIQISNGIHNLFIFLSYVLLGNFIDLWLLYPVLFIVFIYNDIIWEKILYHGPSWYYGIGGLGFNDADFSGPLAGVLVASLGLGIRALLAYAWKRLYMWRKIKN